MLIEARGRSADPIEIALYNGIINLFLRRSLRFLLFHRHKSFFSISSLVGIIANYPVPYTSTRVVPPPAATFSRLMKNASLGYRERVRCRH